MPTILIVPDKFKGTLTARQAAQAIADGAVRAVPGCRCIAAELADGGEGTARLAAGESAAVERFGVIAPDGLPAEVPVYVNGREAFVDSADVIGLTLLSRSPLEPLNISSRPLGLLADALLDRYDRLTIAVGGTATVDGGAGFIEALGARFLTPSDPPAHIYNITPARLPQAAAVDCSAVDAARLASRLRFLIDVDVPLVGAPGAMSSLSFARQKGVTEVQMPLLRDALCHFAALFGADPARLNGAGGGLACIPLLLGAKAQMGADVAAQRIEALIDTYRPDAIVTGEGRFDQQSVAGKGVGRLIALAADRRLPLGIVAGCLGTPLPPLPLHVHLASAMTSRGGVGDPLAADTATHFARISEAAAKIIPEILAKTENSP